MASRVKHVEGLVQIQSEFNRLPFDATRDPETEFTVFGAHGGTSGDGEHLVASVDMGFRLSALPEEGMEIPAELLQETTGRVVVAYVRAADMITYALEAVPVPMFNVYGSRPRPVTYAAGDSADPSGPRTGAGEKRFHKPKA